MPTAVYVDLLAIVPDCNLQAGVKHLFLLFYRVVQSFAL